jgi:hypothetical protein
MTADPFTRKRLELEGFVGWIAFSEMRERDSLPRAGGVYVVVRASTTAPKFMKTNPGGKRAAYF